MPSAAEAVDQVIHGFASRIGHRNFYVDVGGPAGDFAGLPLHFNFVVGEDFERDRPVGNVLENFQGEALVVSDSGLPHQRWISGEALDIGLPVEFEHAGLVGSVGKHLNLQLRHGLHRWTPSNWSA